ncbi:helix-turn-helix domain-containing protein [Ferrimonas futtsuensis]|uniref:helix-turn-helix domain-containing protein n=1 Tax=Ferrimonas futtsuensis TaxID=364764 RepID=UPI0003F6E742|nr:helix-turn-helix domain-containing protein [Ferrimonas futtsuensis]
MLNPTFSRRLILMHEIAHHDKASVPALMKSLGWPRRTIQDVLKALMGMGVQVEFIEDGVRHNDGHYRVADWGPIDPVWVRNNLDSLLATLER